MGGVDVVGIEKIEEDADVFEAGVHALAVKGDHGVGSVAEDDDTGGMVVRRAFDADEGQVRVAGELVEKIGRRDEFRADAGEIGGEEGGEGGAGRGFEGGEGGGRGEEGAGKGPVEGWNGDEHEGTTRPDVQVIGGDGEGAGRVRGGCWRGDGRNVEFAPEGVDVFLLVVEPGEFHKVVADCRMGAVGTNHEVKADFDFLCALLVGFAEGRLGRILCMVSFGCMGTLLEPGNVLVEVGTRELVVEMKGYIGHFLQGVEQTFVKTCTIDGSNELCSLVL